MAVDTGIFAFMVKTPYQLVENGTKMLNQRARGWKKKIDGPVDIAIENQTPLAYIYGKHLMGVLILGICPEWYGLAIPIYVRPADRGTWAAQLNEAWEWAMREQL